VLRAVAESVILLMKIAQHLLADAANCHQHWSLLHRNHAIDRSTMRLTNELVDNVEEYDVMMITMLMAIVSRYK